MSNSFTIEGRITDLEDAARQVSATFQVREFVVEVPDGQYPQLAKFQLVQDKCDLLNDFAIGDEVKVTFNLRGKRSAQGKVFTNLQAWKVERVGVPRAASASVGGAPGAGAPFDDDIPFAPLPWIAS